MQSRDKWVLSSGKGRTPGSSARHLSRCFNQKSNISCQPAGQALEIPRPSHGTSHIHSHILIPKHHRLAEWSICCRDANAAAANPHNRHRRQRHVLPVHQKLSSPTQFYWQHLGKVHWKKSDELFIYLQCWVHRQLIFVVVIYSRQFHIDHFCG